MDRSGNTTNWTNGHWEAKWIPSKQYYQIFYKRMLFAIKYKFSDVEVYLK